MYHLYMCIAPSWLWPSRTTKQETAQLRLRKSPPMLSITFPISPDSTVALKWHPMSNTVVKIKKRLCSFLLVVNSNLSCLTHRYRLSGDFRNAPFFDAQFNPQFKRLVKINASATCPTSYSIEIRFQSPYAMDRFGDICKIRILTLTPILPQMFNWVNFCTVVSLLCMLCVRCMKSVAVAFCIYRHLRLHLSEVPT
jgi:hypothetical protein